MPESSNQNFNHLKIHSQYSICEGAVKIDDLQEFSKLNKIKSLALCDTSNLCGALEFAEKISKVGTQPIIGSQINFKVENTIGKLPVFAKTIEGYKNLTKLSSISYLESTASTEPHCELKNLFENKYRLINITIPSAKLATEMPKTINVFLPHDSKNIYKANFISDAPSSNISLQGKSFFYVVENNNIKLGSKIKADITKINNQVKRKKLFIPSESVVWSSGKPWVFIKKDGDENIFLRKPLINPLETENGWIILEDNLKNNELVVVDGAQLLLSEEFKYQIKNENED